MAILAGAIVRLAGGSTRHASAATLATLTIGAGGLLWYSVLLVRREGRSEHRGRTGCCRECGYDRSSIALTAPCPECGSVVLPIERWLRVDITEFVDTSQPGWVSAEFVDAEGRRWRFTEKAPVLSEDDLGVNTTYPRTGWLRCQEVSRPIRHGGRIIRVRFGPGAPTTVGDGTELDVDEGLLRPVERRSEHAKERPV